MALNTEKFVHELINEGYTHLCVVPCSFAKYLINEAINNTNIEYVPCASEAVACSVAAGLKISGKYPIVIVQSSGLTNMGSCITSLLKPYNITFPIITSWRTYNEGDSEIQHKHLASELPSLIEAYGYKYEILDNNNLSICLDQLNNAKKTFKICILKKDSFSPVELNKKHRIDLSNYPKRSEYLEFLNKKFKNSKEVFIGTTGNTAREMFTYMPNTNNFYMAGNMGGALSLGLGIGLEGNNVFVCGGDAEFVMHMGGLTTAGRYKNKVNLTYILFDNESNKSTGGQNSYQNHLDYLSIASSSGFNIYKKTITNLNEFISTIDFNEKNKCLKFLHVKCNYDSESPRPPLEVVRQNNLYG